MSLIGKKPIQIPDKVKIKIDSGKVFVEGPKGKLDWSLPSNVEALIDNSNIIVKRLKEDKSAFAMHGLARACINNMVKGVSEGYIKTLEIVGVGYRAQTEGKKLTLHLGFSHPIVYIIPDGITIKAPPKPAHIIIEGIDKAKVGEVAAKIRSFFEPEPYKGRGIRYLSEFVRKKAGKAVGGTEK
ncbi:MAG: 50S ribosomal protein L6 [Omnitrophica bacterium GWA2_41_15]|nr:MAG: 50S ribosomal protein L6 [Omnitrophica bacterium GWA2_41_15]